MPLRSGIPGARATFPSVAAGDSRLQCLIPVPAGAASVSSGQKQWRELEGRVRSGDISGAQLLLCSAGRPLPGPAPPGLERA